MRYDQRAITRRNIRHVPNEHDISYVPVRESDEDYIKRKRESAKRIKDENIKKVPVRESDEDYIKRKRESAKRIKDEQR